jgi:hypothetical protein
MSLKYLHHQNLSKSMVLSERKENISRFERNFVEKLGLY